MSHHYDVILTHHIIVVVGLEYCLTSLFDTNGHSSAIVIMLKTVQSIDEINDVQSHDDERVKQ